MSKWLLTRYLLTGLYVGFATLGVSVHWYLDHGVSWSQLLNWSTCIVSLVLSSPERRRVGWVAGGMAPVFARVMVVSVPASKPYFNCFFVRLQSMQLSSASFDKLAQSACRLSLLVSSSAHARFGAAAYLGLAFFSVCEV